jgi:hypothetical protein
MIVKKELLSIYTNSLTQVTPLTSATDGPLVPCAVHPRFILATHAFIMTAIFASEKHIQSVARTHRMLAQCAQPHFVRECFREIAHVHEEVHKCRTTDATSMVLAVFAYLWFEDLRTIIASLRSEVLWAWTVFTDRCSATLWAAESTCW